MKEFGVVSHFRPFGAIRSLLEIGCGNGFTASLLSTKAKSAVAFDLPAKDPKSHSIGIAVTRRLLERLGIHNVDIVGGSAEELPFADRSFDMIYSGYMLQYVRKKDRALQEMQRVLEPDGVVITIVPNFIERVVTPVIKYEYVIKRACARLLALALRKAGASGAPSTGGTPQGLGRALSDWLLLRPDGSYKSFMQELVRHTPYAWKGLFERNGFAVIDIFSTELLPLGVLDVLSAPVRRFASRKSSCLSMLFGNAPVIKWCGYSLCIVAKKKM